MVHPRNVSNIFTEFVRFYLHPGASMSAPEAEALIARVIGERGSYWVPVWYDRTTPGRLDLQYGSGKSVGLFGLSPDDLAAVEEVWVRFADEGADVDVIYTWAPALDEDVPDGYGRKRPCRYGFDEVRVVARDRRAAMRALPSELPWQETAEGWRLACEGSHLALNTRTDMGIGPGVLFGDDGRRTPGGVATATTPSHGATSIGAVEPAALAALVQKGDGAIERVDLQHASRLVHRAGWGTVAWSKCDEWQSRCADDWDNCRDEDFVRDALRRG